MDNVLKVFAGAIWVLVIFSGVARSEESSRMTAIFGLDPHWLGVKQTSTFQTIMSDEVSGGCWTNKKAVQTAIELELNRSNYKIEYSDKKTPNYKVFVASVGFIKAGFCVVTYNLEVWRLDATSYHTSGHEVLSLRRAMLWSGRGVLTGAKQKMSNWLKETYTDLIKEFLVDINKNREAVLNRVRGSATGEEKTFWNSFAPK